MFHFATSDLFVPLLVFVNILTSWTQQVLPLNVLVSTPHPGPNTWNITSRQYLNASLFYLVMEPDCNLVTYNGSTPFLTTNITTNRTQDNLFVPVGPSSSRNCYATMQADGNFVVYQLLNATHKFAVWASETYSYGYNNSIYRCVILQRDGSVGVHEPDGTAMTFQYPFMGAVNVASASNLPPELEWRPSLPLDGYPYMPVGYFLSQGTSLQTTNGRFILMLDYGCKLQSQEIWKENGTVKRVVWESVSGVVVSGSSCELRLQQDGRLEVRDSGVVHWNSTVSGDDDSVSWVVKVDPDDGHVSVSDILNSSHVLWSSSMGSGAESTLGNGRSVRVWPVVVGVVGGVFSTAVIALAVWYFCFQPSVVNVQAEKAFKQRLQRIGGRSRVMSEAKIKQATNNFGCRIGYGGFGDVFYGKLEDGQEIAAKVLSSGSHQSKEEFYNEIELLSVVHYKYLVTLIGYSVAPQHQILIYEFMSGGDLRHRLSQGGGSAGNVNVGTVSAAESPLSWRQRTSITLQVAEGIEYLHDKCTPAIIHRDIKSNNILLTNNWVAKVADFGLSKLRSIDQQNATHITTVVKGTPGYLDPEYHKTGLLTEKSDVYAFGIVMMEILTGQQQMNIAEKVFEARRSGNLEALVDPHLEGDYDTDEFVNIVDLSLWCVRKRSGNRPFMRQVVQRLREIVVAPLESSAQPKVLESKAAACIINPLIEVENSHEVARHDTGMPFSGFSTGDVKSGTWRPDQVGDRRFSEMFDHSSSQSSAGN